ncbi:MAG: hypothetical protein GYA23_12985 [Methanomicrobiales archaeon]|nr:hypothetical protein [Methanomicrobiales archaeon]
MVLIPLAVPHNTLPVVPPTPEPTVKETIPVITGTVNAVNSLATKEDVRAFIRSHTAAGTTTGTTIEDQPMVTVPANARTFTFDIDTSTFVADEYIVTASAVREDVTATELFNVISKPTGIVVPTTMPLPMPTRTPVTSGQGEYYISLVPPGDRIVGDRFSIIGTTNLPEGEEILIQVYSSSFKPTQKSQSGEFSGATGTVKTQSSATRVPIPTMAVTAAPTAASRTAAPVTASPDKPSGAEREYSKTNVQEEMVDEGDIIKTDGTSIYVVTGNCLHILRAYPATTAEIVSTLRFAGSPRELYVNGNQLILIASDARARPVTECRPGYCYSGNSNTDQILIYVFSVADPAKPYQVRELSVDGAYTTSRMIGKDLYFITGTSIPYDLDDLELPVIRDDHGGISTPPVYGFNTTDQTYGFSTIGSLDLTGTRPVTAKSFIIGKAGTVYVSPTHAYVAVPDQSWGWTRSTTIHAFAIRDGMITWDAGGRVDGTLLDRYSLDEHNGYLRVATTVDTGALRGRSTTYSKVTVLDKDLDITGTLPDIAPDERIYSARFMGERLYLVTFRQTDPFWVISLENPRQPKILGELQLPGYSNYLHPYDENHIIGIGKETDRGPVKIALFDVTNVHNPGLMDSETFGSGFSTSAVLEDPKAFLFDHERDLMVLPLHIQGEVPSCNYGYACTIPSSWGGAYVFSVTPKSGFVLKGTVTHYDGQNGAPVRRSLYIDQTLYTMSDDKIVMSDMARDMLRVKAVNLR